MMLIVVDPHTWSRDPQSGRATSTVPLTAGTERVVLTIELEEPRAGAAPPEVRSDCLLGDPVVRQVGTTIAVECTFLCTERSSATIFLDRRPALMRVRLSGARSGIVAWRSILPSALAHPVPARAAFSPFDFAAVDGMLKRNEVDKVIDELTAVWLETSPSQKVAAAAMLFDYLADHPLKRTVVLGTLIASLCDFQAST